MGKHAEGSAQHLGIVKTSLIWEPAARIAYTIQLHAEEPERIFQDVLASLSKFCCQSLVKEFMLGPFT